VDEDGNDRSKSGSDGSDGLEVWGGVTTEELERDIPATTPSPEPEKRKSKLEKMNALVFWLAHLLLILQTSCKLSDNDLGVSVSNDFLAELIVCYTSYHRLCISYANSSTWKEITLHNMLSAQNAQSYMLIMHA